MNKKFRSFMAFMAVLALHPATAMDESMMNQEAKFGWKFEECFTRDKEYSFRQFTAYNTNENDYVKEIHLFSNQHGSLGAHIIASEKIKTPSINLPQSIGLQCNLEWNGSKGKDKKFLKHFYNYKLIPDFVMNRLLRELNAINLTLNGSLILELIEKEKKNETLQEFMRLVHFYLSKIDEEKKRQESAIYIIESLPKSSHDLILDLATTYVKNPHFPGYTNVQIMLSDIHFLKGDGYEKSILPLLSVKEWDEKTKTQLNTFIKYMFFQGKLSTQSLPEELLNLKLTPEHLLNVILFTCKQQKRIEELENELANLKK